MGVNEGTLGNWVTRAREEREGRGELSKDDYEELKRLRAEVGLTGDAPEPRDRPRVGLAASWAASRGACPWRALLLVPKARRVTGRPAQHQPGGRLSPWPPSGRPRAAGLMVCEGGAGGRARWHAGWDSSAVGQRPQDSWPFISCRPPGKIREPRGAA
jgi:hypothetical protein